MDYLPPLKSPVAITTLCKIPTTSSHTPIRWVSIRIFCEWCPLWSAVLSCHFSILFWTSNWYQKSSVSLLEKYGSHIGFLEWPEPFSKRESDRHSEYPPFQRIGFRIRLGLVVLMLVGILKNYRSEWHLGPFQKSNRWKVFVPNFTLVSSSEQLQNPPSFKAFHLC